MGEMVKEEKDEIRRGGSLLDCQNGLLASVPIGIEEMEEDVKIHPWPCSQIQGITGLLIGFCASKEYDPVQKMIVHTHDDRRNFSGQPLTGLIVEMNASPSHAALSRSLEKCAA
jgi:hypothetical protein